MKFLKEAFGQSEEFNDFIYQLNEKFNTYYVVTLEVPSASSESQKEYFYSEDSAKEYYDKLKADLPSYWWDFAFISLEKVTIEQKSDTIEEFNYDAKAEEDVEIEEEK